MATEPQLANFSYWKPEKEIGFWAIMVGSFKISFVAVLETLISARIADNKTETRHDQSKEIRAMSIANIVCGLMGGTPCTGVLIRTNANVQTGATHKMSQFINAVIVFLFVVLASRVIVYLPMSIIAAILFTSSCRLVPLTVMKQLWRAERVDFWILIVTWLLCVFMDGAAGLLIGSFVCFLRLSRKTSETQMSYEFLDGHSSGEKKKILKVELDGSLNYINSVHFELKVLDLIKAEEPDYVMVNLMESFLFADMDGLMVLEKIFKKRAGATALVLQRPDDESVLQKSWWFQEIKGNNMVFASVNEAKAGLLKDTQTQA